MILLISIWVIVGSFTVFAFGYYIYKKNAKALKVGDSEDSPNSRRYVSWGFSFFMLLILIEWSMRDIIKIITLIKIKS